MVHGELFGVARWQNPFSPASITELLLCARCPAGCLRLCTTRWVGAGHRGPGPLLAGSMALEESLPSLALKFFGHKVRGLD